MVDYTRATGSSGTMMIRDHGGTIEFWLKAGSATFDNQLPWGYTANNSNSGWLQFRFASGGAWQLLGSVHVGYSQNVTFHMGSTGTSGLGGPTDFTVWINRASRPAPPNPPYFTDITDTGISAHFTDGPDNGAPIDAREIWGSHDHTPRVGAPIHSYRFENLTPGTMYYFWGRTHNSQGWSDWSARSQAATYKVPDAPNPVVLTNITQNSLHAEFSGNSQGGTPAREWQIGYGLSPDGPSYFRSEYNTDFTNMQPGRLYYFWARGRNDIGWGPWSARSSAQLIAGAYVKHNKVWSRAVPYINVNGQWKLARPWARAGGVWKETAS